MGDLYLPLIVGGVALLMALILFEFKRAREASSFLLMTLASWITASFIAVGKFIAVMTVFLWRIILWIWEE